MSRFVRLERSVLHSPAWFVPFDDFARRVHTASMTVELDLWDGARWVPQDTRAVRTPGGAVGYPGLGRRGDATSAPPESYRVRFAAPGRRPLYPADGEPFSSAPVGVEFAVQPYDDDANPPAVRAEPRLVRLLPSASFPYPPGVRTVRGVVRDADSGAPVGNALVEARGHSSRDAVAWHERALSDAAGAFRLALRWEGDRADEDAVEETFHLKATERPGRAGSLTVQLPRDADHPHVIEIREQREVRSQPCPST